MTDRTYATWVRPIATVLSADRRRVIAFARSLPDDAWNESAKTKAWTMRDILAHLAGGNDQLVQTILRSVTKNAPLDDSALQPDTDAENAARVEERRGWRVEELIAELERDGDEVQELLSRLTEQDEDRYLRGLSMSLGQFLLVVEHERHDAEHLRQMNPGEEST
jgi:uncharacterized damage-inducible protein DinB